MFHEREISQTCAIHDGAENVEDCNQSVSVPAEDRTGRWARVTFKIVLSYHGGSFDGWQKQPGLNTVQGYVLSYCLQKYFPTSKRIFLCIAHEKEQAMPDC